MVLILLSWIYIFFTALSFGIATSKALRITQFEIVLTPILGLFSITISATIWAFFGPISFGFHLVLLFLSVFLCYKNKATFNAVLQAAFTQIKLFSFSFILLFVVSCLLILAQSATLPFIIDNESYYIQTIKWLNEYGFVKGLANLHLFLGQTSGWHITQSVFSFSFLYDRFNDLNGFCLLLGNFFAFQKLHDYYTNGNKMDLVFGLLPLTYVFLFQFVSAPSPDLPVYIFSFIVFSLYLQNKTSQDTFLIMTLICLFAFFSKVTAVILFVFPLIVLLINYSVVKKHFLSAVGLSSLVLVLFVIKNVMLTGYPLFPMLCFRMNDLDYTVPAIIMNFFFSKSVMHSFYIKNAVFPTTSLIDLAKHYFLYNGMLGYIGLVSLLTLFVTPILIVIKRLPKTLWLIYFAYITLAVLLCYSSPQYRFYVHFTIFFLLLLLSFWINNPKWIFRFYTASMLVVAVLVFVPVSFRSLTSNNLLSQNSTFHLINSIVPEPNSKWKPEYKGGSVGNMSYQSPVDTSFFWVTGNGKLPCVNSEQVKYFENGFFYIPQQRSIDLSDGFYAQKISGHE